ncbi:mitotic-spindle organizing gamma-tubulin ring associated-domain-containing protein [Pseudoneurospora amorphoporcata]|uniref:Mitotic-spindle organizing protein 1 n=1 Tax=Pseudoneurospora amorphoporcata TaxID=241081 RepID=A0AAN6P0V4_9PEZI|nr:mitotic-spindle organizing gamma-tubulin ring associated-domain-containing protein [Pseudoneurospora amorphoporcata]
MEKSEKQAAAQQAVDILHEISTILNCQLDRRTLSICISMIENGVKPEALAMIGGERILPRSQKRGESSEEDDQDQMDTDLASDGKNQRYLAAPNDTLSRYHLGLTVSTLRWVIFRFRAWKTKFPPLCLSDSKLDPLAVDLIRRLHVLFRKEEFSSEMMRARRASRSRTPDENGRNDGLPLGLRRARRAQSAPSRTERFDYNQDMLRLVREGPLISTSLQPSPTSSWRGHDHLDGEGWRQMEEEEPAALKLWKSEGEINRTESEQGQTRVETEVMEVCETEEEEENKDESREQEEQASLVKTEVIEVQSSSSSNSSDGENEEAVTKVEVTEMSISSSRSSSFAGDETLVQD